MVCNNVLETLHQHERNLKSYSVRHLSMLGGVTTNAAHPDGCVDLFVEFEHTVGRYVYFDLQSYLEDLLDCQVDLGSIRSLEPEEKEEVLEEAIPVT